MNKGTLLLLFIFIFSINIISIKAEENENPNSILKQEENKGFGKKLWEKIKSFFSNVIEFIKTKTGLIVVISVASAILLLVLTIILYKVIKHKKEKDDIPYINFYDSSKNPNLKYDKSLNNISIPSDSNSKDSETSVPFQSHFKQNTFMNSTVQGSESYSPVVPPNYNSSSSNTNLFNKYGSNPRINNLDTPSPSSYDDLNKGRPEPQNIFDGGFYPNRSSSLLGEDDVKRLNGIMTIRDENSATMVNNEEKNNIKPNKNYVDIDLENIPNEFKDLKTYRVIHKFKPHRDDELVVERNQLLKVIKSFEDGWALCYNINSKDKGFIPMNKLKLLDEKLSESENEQNGAFTRASNNDNTLNTLGSNTASTKEIISNIMNIKKMDDFEIKQGSDINEITNKLSPSSEQDKLTFKYDDIEESEEHRIIIEDNTLSHDNSCHVVFDYTDTTANSFINYPSFGIQYDSQQQYSQSSQDLGIDTYLNVRKSFVPTKSKLHSMEVGNDTTDDSIDNINYYINNSIINNSSSFSQQSVQNLSLSRQLFTATPSGLNPKRHKRSSSQPTPYSEDEFDAVPKQNKNSSLGRLRSKSNGRLETEYDNRRKNMYPAGNMDAKITNEIRYGPTPGRFDNYLRNQRITENNGKINEEEKRNSYFATDQRRISVNKKEEELVTNPNFNSESRKRSVIIENDNVYYVNDMMPAKAMRAREDTNLPRYREERPPVNPVVYRNIMKSLGNANGMRGNIRPAPVAVNIDNYRGIGNMRSPYKDEINPNIPQAALMEQRAYIQQTPLMEQRTYIQQAPLVDQRQFIQQRPFMEQRPIDQRPMEPRSYVNRSDIEETRTPRTPRDSEPRTPRTPRDSEPRTPRTPRDSEPRTPRTPKSPYTSYGSNYYPDTMKSKSSNTSLKRDNPKSPYIVNNPGYRNDNTVSYEQY